MVLSNTMSRAGFFRGHKVRVRIKRSAILTSAALVFSKKPTHTTHESYVFSIVSEEVGSFRHSDKYRQMDKKTKTICPSHLGQHRKKKCHFYYVFKIYLNKCSTFQRCLKMHLFFLFLFTLNSKCSKVKHN